MSSCVEPLQTDLTSVTGRQLQSPPEPPPQPPPAATGDLLIPARHTQTHSVTTPTFACWSQGYLKTSEEFLLDLMTQWEIVGCTFLCRAGLRLELEPIYAAVTQTPLVPESRSRSAAEDPLGLTLNFHDLCSGREAGWNTTITLFLLSNHFISSPRFFSHLIPHSNSIPGKERKHILKVTQELIILLEEKVLSMWLPASIGAFQSIEARFSLLKLGIEDIIKVIAVAWWTLDIDSLWMLLFIDKGKCWAKTWLTSLVIQNINVEGIWYNPGCLLSNPTVCWRAVKCFLLIFCSSDTATFK